MKPQRIQQKRTKGFKLPPNSVSVARPHKHGNPFVVGWHVECWTEKVCLVKNSQDAVDFYRAFATKKLRDDPHWFDDVRGKNVSCFCKVGEPCHADVILELANKVSP